MQKRTRQTLFASLTSILWIPALKANILFENRKVFEILDYLQYVYFQGLEVQCSMAICTQ